MKLAIIAATTAVATLALSTAASAGECRDPWVTTAIYEFTGHKPRGSGESLDCNIKLYGNGSWSSYPDLFAKVRASYRDPMPQAGIASGVNGATVSGAARPGIAGGVSGGNMVAAGGGNMVAAGGGNMVAAGGGNMVAAGGGNMVAAGGGNLKGGK